MACDMCWICVSVSASVSVNVNVSVMVCCCVYDVSLRYLDKSIQQMRWSRHTWKIENRKERIKHGHQHQHQHQYQHQHENGQAHQLQNISCYIIYMM